MTWVRVVVLVASTAADAASSALGSAASTTGSALWAADRALKRGVYAVARRL